MHSIGKLDGRVLVIEDDPGIQKLVTRLIGTTNAQAEIVSSGGEALSRLPFDTDVILVILDLNLPDMSGVEVLKKLRQVHDSLPVVISTGLDESTVRTALGDKTHTYYLRKPYQIAVFWQAIGEALRDRGSDVQTRE